MPILLCLQGNLQIVEQVVAGWVAVVEVHVFAEAVVRFAEAEAVLLALFAPEVVVAEAEALVVVVIVPEQLLVAAVVVAQLVLVVPQAEFESVVLPLA